MSRVNAFNPAAFQQQNTDKSEAAADKQPKKDLPYEVTDVSSRDSVRKMLWEILGASDLQDQSGQQDQNQQIKIQPGQLVAEMETQIFKLCNQNAKTREYRDRCNKLQQKIKGPRNTQVRQDLKMGVLSIDKCCSDEYLNSKTATTSLGGPAGMGRGGPAMARGRGGIPGAVRGRGGPPGLMARGRGAPPPITRPPAAQLEQIQSVKPESKDQLSSQTDKQDKPDQKLEEAAQNECQDNLGDKQTNQELKQIQTEATESTSEQLSQAQTQKDQAETELKSDNLHDQQNKTPQAQFNAPKPMGRGAIRGPVRGQAQFRGRGGGPPQRAPLIPSQRTPVIPQSKGTPPRNKETDQVQNQTDDSKENREVEIKTNQQSNQQKSQDPCQDTLALEQQINDHPEKHESVVNEGSKIEESNETSRVELEFPNNSQILAADDILDQVKNDEKLSQKSGSEKNDRLSTYGQETSNKDLSNPKSDSHCNDDSNSQAASQSELKMPNIDASMDDSHNTSISLQKKKKVKKIKKVKKKLKNTDQSLESSMLQENILRDQLREIQNNQVSQIQDEKINMPLQIKHEPTAKNKPVELSADQLETIIKEKKDSKGQIALLTKEKLEQLDRQFPNQFGQREIDDTDIESVFLDQSAFSPRVPIQPAQEIVQQVANQLDLKPIEIDKHPQNIQNSQKVMQQPSQVEQQVAKDGHTIKSKSMSQSQVGAQDSELVRRLQETLQQKKEMINELNQKYQTKQSDHQILQKKYNLVQEENSKLKEELSKQKANFRQNEERVFSLNQQINQKDQKNKQTVKEKEELISQLINEVNSLKSERDLYQERYQRAIKESTAERHNIDKKIHLNSFNNSTEIINILKSVQGFSNQPDLSLNQIDAASSGGPSQVVYNTNSSRMRDD